jgi:hypothetical protein
MRVVWRLVSFFAGSIAVGAGCFVAAGFATGTNLLFEGLLGLAMLAALIGALSSGTLLLVIGPKVIKDGFYRRR